ncbi:MAG: general secretion pathway protein, partial [Pirellulales bacterium]|nr:general secretion pathway protein [Pirellulales bacterium]
MKTIFAQLLLVPTLAGLPLASVMAQEATDASAVAQDATPATVAETAAERTDDAAVPASPSDRPSATESDQAASTPAGATAVQKMMDRRGTGNPNEPALWLNFSRADWKSVLEWFSDEAQLSLEYDQLPQGSLTYSDPARPYTISESLDVINLNLMKRGYALVRRGRSLQVIDLEADNAEKLISEIAELVKPEDLDRRGESDIVSCVFGLGSMTPDAAKEELPQMVGPWGRVIVLDSARQVKVTETASKLKAIRTLLATASSADSQVIELELVHRGADELLELARPLLGLEPGENVNDEIRISVSVYGDLILATGNPGKLSLLEAIVKKRDKPLPEADPNANEEAALPTFKTHFVSTADITTVFDVLQTMLSGQPDTRVGIDPNTKAIIARARPETQELIANTIAQMEGRGQDFKVITLKRLDPSQALLTINKFFGVTDEGGDGPIVDGDPVTGRLWVRGTTEQIELVEKLIRELEGEDALSGLGDKVRLLPYTGRAAEDALDQIRGLWPVTGRSNRIHTRSPHRNGGSGRGIPERRVIREPDVQTTPPKDPPTPATTEANHQADGKYQLITEPVQSNVPVQSDVPVGPDNPEDKDPQPEASTDQSDGASIAISVDGADIIVQMTPAGIIVASEDTEALNAFEALMSSIASPSALQSDLPTIFWLKYAKADVAAELISSVMGGSEGTLTSAVDTVTGGGFSGMLGLLGGGGGGSDASSSKSILTATGSVSIVPDMRLNALIVQANAIDLQMIELILEKIDRQESPEDIETTAKPQLIPVIYQDANDVAEVVKSVFADRIAGNNNN